MFDFNGDGRTDSGEQFTGYQIFKDTTQGGTQRGGRLTTFDKIMIGLLIWQIISLFFGR